MILIDRAPCPLSSCLLLRCKSPAGRCACGMRHHLPRCPLVMLFARAKSPPSSAGNAALPRGCLRRRVVPPTPPKAGVCFAAMLGGAHPPPQQEPPRPQIDSSGNERGGLRPAQVRSAAQAGGSTPAAIPSGSGCSSRQGEKPPAFSRRFSCRLPQAEAVLMPATARQVSRSSAALRAAPLLLPRDRPECALKNPPACRCGCSYRGRAFQRVPPCPSPSEKGKRLFRKPRSGLHRLRSTRRNARAMLAPANCTFLLRG